MHILVPVKKREVAMTMILTDNSFSTVMYKPEQSVMSIMSSIDVTSKL